MKKIMVFLLMLCLVVSAVMAKDSGKTVAEKQVKAAIDCAKKRGKDVALAEINKGVFQGDGLLMTVYDREGICRAYPMQPARIGQCAINDRDPGGNLFVQDRLDLVKTHGKGWLQYKMRSNETKEIFDTDVYCEEFEGLIFSAAVPVKH